MEAVNLVVQVILKLFCLAKGLNCSRSTFILMPQGTGKSWISSNMTSRDAGSLILDLEELSQLSLTKDQSETVEKLKNAGSKQSLLLFLLPLWKAYFKDLREKFPSRDVFILTSHPETLSYLKKYISKKYVFVPSEAFFQQILSQVDDEGKKKAMTASRTAILAAFGAKARVFTSYPDLSSQLNAELSITQRV